MGNSKHCKNIVLIILSIIFLILLFIDSPAFKNHRLWSEVWNFGHIITFYTWTYLLLGISKRFNALSLHYQIIYATVAVLAISTGVEAIQLNLARTASIGDILYSLLGSLIAIAFISKQKKKTNKTILIACQTILIILLFIPILITGKIISDEVFAHYQFPVLSNFETPFELSRWENIRSETSIVTNKLTQSNALKIELAKNGYSGITLSYFKRNWNTFRRLNLDLYTEKDSIELTISINDKQHEQQGYNFNDRYTKAVILQPGLNRISIPLKEVINAPATRKMNLAHIKAITITARELKYSQFVFLDDVYLN